MLVLVLLLVLAASCRHVEPLPAEALHDLESLDAFKQSFNAAADRHRLVVLLSPT